MTKDTRSTSTAQSRTSNAAKADRKSRPTPKPSKLTKKSQLIQMLSKRAGADAANISKKFGWLPHTTRAALSRLRKAGYEISSMKPGTGKPAKYRITSAPPEESAQ